MAKRKGITPESAAGTFLPMGVTFPMAGAAMGISAASAGALRAAGQPGAGALMDVATMGVAVKAIDVTGVTGKKFRL